MDKMLRIAGRGSDGTAKPIKTDNKGNIGVQLNGQRVPEMATIIDKKTVAANGNTGYTSLGLDGTETEVWVFIESDKAPWTARTRGYPWNTGNAYSFALFPRRFNEPNTFDSVTPAISYLNGIPPAYDAKNLGVAETLEDAKKSALYFAGNQIMIENKSAEQAVITVKVLRSWGAR